MSQINELIASSSIRAYNTGYQDGVNAERERIVGLLKAEAVIIHTQRAEEVIRREKETHNV